MATTTSKWKEVYLWAVFALLLHFSTYLEGRRSPEGLYKSSDDDVVVLVASNFYKTVLSSDKAWMIEFYSSWCGHCVHFAPTWKKFANEIKAWRSVVAIGAIDCAESDNHAVCQAEHIMGYPAMKKFPPNAKNGSGVAYKGGRLLRELQSELIHHVASLPPLPKWPRLKPANTSDVFQLYEQSKTIGASALFVIFEEVHSDLGAEVMLDLSAMETLSKQILRLKSEDQPLVEKWSVPGIPAVFVWPVDDKPVELEAESPSREGFVEAIKEYYKKNRRESKKTEKPDSNVESDRTDEPEEPVKISNETK